MMNSQQIAGGGGLGGSSSSVLSSDEQALGGSQQHMTLREQADARAANARASRAAAAATGGGGGSSSSSWGTGSSSLTSAPPMPHGALPAAPTASSVDPFTARPPTAPLPGAAENGNNAFDDALHQAQRARNDWKVNGPQLGQAHASAVGGEGGSGTLQPRWVPDGEVANCMGCSAQFDWIKRKHHCRYCGAVFCAHCTAQRSLLPVDFGTRDPQRVCTPCSERLQPLQAELMQSNSNAVKENKISEDGARRYFNSPLSFTMGAEIRKAAYTLGNMCNRRGLGGVIQDASIPIPILQRAQGLAFLTVIKVGFMFAGRIGTGLVVARTPDGTWSAPSAIGTAGFSWGAQIGGEVTDFVIVLMNQSAVDAFSGLGQISVGAELSVAAGPLGRSATASGNLGDGGIAPAYSYSHSRGFFAGISLEGAIITARNDVNKKFYGCVKDRGTLLGGQEPRPPAAQPLYSAIENLMNAQAGGARREAGFTSDDFAAPSTSAYGAGGGR